MVANDFMHIWQETVTEHTNTACREFSFKSQWRYA